MRLARSVLTIVALTALAASGCGSNGPHGSGGEAVRSVGSIDMMLSLPNGTTINSLNYSISHSNGYSKQGDIPLQNSNTVTFQVGSIPTGSGYQIALTATTSDGTACSAGPVSFAVQAGNTTLVMMTLRCGGGATPSGNGQVRVDVDTVIDPSCPQVDGLTATPREVTVGSSLALIGQATTSPATFAWTVDPASGGSFAAPSAETTTFTCNAAGTHTVTLSVIGGASCTPSTTTLPVICSTGTGAGGAGGSAAGAGGAAGTVAGAGGTEAGAGGTEAGAGGSVAGAGGTGGSEAGAGGTEAGAGGTEAGAGGSVAGAGGAGGAGGSNAACITCRQQNCSDYMGSGLNLYAGCFLAVDDSQGAAAADPTFLQNCIDLVNCAFANNCAYGLGGAGTCYCGSATADQCIQSGPAADAACVPQVQAASRSTVNDDITSRLSDFAYPIGWANFLLECDRDLCNSEASGKCTP